MAGKKNFLMYILIGFFILLCFGAIVFIGLVNSIWSAVVGMFGWIFVISVCAALIFKIKQLKYCRSGLVSLLNTNMDLAYKLGTQQFISKQLLNERNQLVAVINGQSIKKKIKN